MDSCIICNHVHVSERQSLDDVYHDQTLRHRLEKVLGEPVLVKGWMCFSCQFDLKQIEIYYSLLNLFKQRYKDTAQQFKQYVDYQKEDSNGRSMVLEPMQFQTGEHLKLDTSDHLMPVTAGKDIKSETIHYILDEVQSQQTETAINDYFSRPNDPQEIKSKLQGLDLEVTEICNSDMENATVNEYSESDIEEPEGKGIPSTARKPSLKKLEQHGEISNIGKTKTFRLEPIRNKRPSTLKKSSPYIEKYSKINNGSFECPNCDKIFRKLHGLGIHMRMHEKKQKVTRLKLGEEPFHDQRERNIQSTVSIDESCPKNGYSSSTVLRRNKRFTHKTLETDRIEMDDTSNEKNEDVDGEHSENLEIEILKCALCDENYQTEIGLATHMRWHVNKSGPTEEHQVSCTICGMSFYKEESFKAHIKVHNTNGKHKLKKKSDPDYEHESKLSAHKEQQQIQGDDSEGDLRKKKQTVQKMYVYNFPCTLCDRKFNRKYRLRNHMVTHTGDWPTRCSVCHKGFITSLKLKAHMSIKHSNIKPHSCNQCGKAFKSLNKLETHMKYHSEDALSCIVCAKSFDRNSSLFVHMKTHTVHTLLPCPSCKKIFNTNISLTAHMQCHMKKERGPEMKHPCWKCGKTFSKSKIKNHIMTHTDEGKHSCSVCGKIFYTKGGVAKHMIVHETVRPYKCDQCDLSFKTSSYLKTHKYCHTIVHQFQCSVCGKAFRQNKNLQRHMRYHTDSANFPCTVCWRPFREEHNMKDHMKTHSNAKPYPCTICNISFRQIRTLKRHMRKHAERPDKLPRTRVIKPSNAYERARQQDAKSTPVQQSEQPDAPSLGPQMLDHSLQEISVPKPVLQSVPVTSIPGLYFPDIPVLLSTSHVAKLPPSS